MSTSNRYVVIMAGGIGSRFWPMSKTSHPKQFLDILGTGQTLIQMTYKRFQKYCPKENILIVTNDEYKQLVMDQLEGIDERSILCEPSRRNTAPCIAYATYKIKSKNPEASMVIAPADHLILNEDEFLHCVELALNQAINNSIVTLGIKPSRPDTGYGYIQFKDEEAGLHESVRKVKTFTEKPDHEIALTFLESGDFFWNSGLFISTVSTMVDSFENYLPEVGSLFEAGTDKYFTAEEKAFIDETYAVCTNISIDYAIMEKAKNVYVVLSDFGWSDLGTWGSLYTHLNLDAQKNAIVGKEVRLYDSSNNLVNIPKGKLAVIQGLDDYIVVDTPETLLIVKKEDEQKIKQFVNDLKADKKEKFV